MKILKAATLMFLIYFFAGCSSISVTTDYDHDFDFSKFKTYKFYDGKPSPGDELSKHPLVKKRVQISINKAMLAKGFKLNESDEADFIVVLHAGIKEKMQVHNWGRYGWYDPWWGPYGGYTDVSYYDETTVVVDIVDTRAKVLVWRGLMTGIVRGKGKDQEFIDETMAKILKDFPPKTTK